MNSIYLFSFLWINYCFAQEVIASGDFENEIENLFRRGSPLRHVSDSSHHAPCHPSPCKNGATCFIDQCNQTGCYDFKCECTDDFEGEVCSTPKYDIRELQMVSNSTVCSDDKCVGAGCNCVESCRHENGYYCVNSMGFMGDDCSMFPPLLECNENEIVLQIPHEFVLQFTTHIQNSTMFISHFYDDESSSNPFCQAQLVRSDAAYVIAVPLPFSTCGNTEKLGEQIIYKNTLWIDQTTSSIYRFPQPMLSFSCSYEMSYIVTTSLLPVLDVPATIKGDMKGEVSVGLCKVSTCDRACPSHLVVQKGAVYTVAQRIHVNVRMDEMAAFRSEVSEVHLSCSSSPNTTTDKEVIIQKGCATESLLDAKLSQRMDGIGACMSFRVPKLTSCREVYLHVTLRLCLPQDYVTKICGDNGSWVGHCSAPRQKRSVAADPSVSHHRVGPIIFLDGSEGLDKITLKSDEGDAVVYGKKPQPSNPLLPAQKSTKTPEFDTTKLVIGFLAFAGTLMLICVSLLVYSYSKRRQEHEESVLI